MTQPAAALGGSTVVTAAACNGGSTGGITLTVSGGTSAFTYLWSNTATSKDLTNVAAGTYSVTITDSKSCTATVSATVGQPAAIGLSTAITRETCPGSNDGAVALTVSGGTSGYTYAWAGPASYTATTQNLTSRAA